MIVNMSASATAEQINHIVERIQECGYQAHLIQGAERTVIGAVGNNGRRSEIEALRAAPGVQDVIQITHPFKLVSRQLQQRCSIVAVSGVLNWGRQRGGDGWAVLCGIRRTVI